MVTLPPKDTKSGQNAQKTNRSQGRLTKVTYRALWLVTAVLLGFGAYSSTDSSTNEPQSGATGELAAATEPIPNPTGITDPTAPADNADSGASALAPQPTGAIVWKTPAPPSGVYGPASITLALRARNAGTLTDIYQVESTGGLTKVDFHSNLCAAPELTEGDVGNDRVLNDGERWLVQCVGPAEIDNVGISFSISADGPAATVRADWSSPAEPRR